MHKIVRRLRRSIAVARIIPIVKIVVAFLVRFRGWVKYTILPFVVVLQVLVVAAV